VADEDKHETYFPIVAGLAFAPDAPPPSAWAEEDRADFWRSLLEDLPKTFQERLAASSGRLELGPMAASGTSAAAAEPTVSPSVALVPAGAPSPERRYLLDAPTRIDRGAAILQAHAGGLHLPRKWKDARRWEDLVQEEVERLRETFGDEAFRDLRKETKDPNAHGKLLDLKTTGEGETFLTLTKEAEDALLASIGHKGFRRKVRDADGAEREYLIKRFPVRGGAGYMEARLSWYGQAWPLVDEGREKAKQDLEALRESLRLQSLPFEDLDTKTQAQVDSRLRVMESIRDAREIMGAILYAFGARGENPLRVPAWNLRTLLECENDPHGFRRVRGCLRALQEVHFHLKVAGVPGISHEASGPFLGTVAYIPGGPGEHTDGDFVLHLSEAFVGCLKVFQNTAYRIQSPHKVLTYDWGRKLSREGRTSIGEEGGYLKGFSAVAPYFDRAKGFSANQSNLRRWIEENVTRRKDPKKKGSPLVRVSPTAQDAEEPRLYGRETCPLLPEGRLFHGALSHFKRGENGRTLAGTSTRPTKTSGAHTAGLLVEMGYSLPPGAASGKRQEIARKALQDMRAVVEEAFGGIVAGKHGDLWLTLKDAEKLPVDTLLKKVSWWLFLAEDWRDRFRQEVEAYHAERHARGETPYLVKVTKDRNLVDKAEASRGLPEEAVGLDGEPLRVRLYITRRDKKLSQAAVGALFGVSQATINYWETGPEPGEDGEVRGKAIPADVAPLLLRWVESGTPPTEDELAALATRRTVRPGTKKETPS
jgi:hypothetical protein